MNQDTLQKSLDHGEITTDAPELSRFADVTGKILAVSYPVLALSTGARGLYQLFLKEGVTNYVPPLLTTIAAALYLVAAVGFARRSKRAWTVSVVALSLEMVGIAVVGTLSYVRPDLVGETAWRHFGADYGYFPFIQPLLGLIWLLHPQTLRAYRIRRSPTT
ncbi:MAG: hypothetical protein RRC07_18240 [Anaerolineae bacterium]|nr:hypothetical protein [Anaerolineae bacterium]